MLLFAPPPCEPRFFVIRNSFNRFLVEREAGGIPAGLLWKALFDRVGLEARFILVPVTTEVVFG